MPPVKQSSIQEKLASFYGKLTSGAPLSVAPAVQKVKQTAGQKLDAFQNALKRPVPTINEYPARLGITQQAIGGFQKARDTLFPKPQSEEEALAMGLIPVKGPSGNQMNIDPFGTMGSLNQAAKKGADVTLKSLKALAAEVKTPTVAKQYLLDLSNRGDLKQPERDLIRRVLEDMGDRKGEYTEGSKKMADLIAASENRVPLTEAGGVRFDISDFGRKALARKEAQTDRFPANEIQDTLANSQFVFRASKNPSEYRYDNYVFATPTDDGIRAVYARENADGGMDIINAHSVPKEKLAKYLDDIGVPSRTRTDILSLERSKSNPLTYGDSRSLAQRLQDVKGETVDDINVSDFTKRVETELLPLKTARSDRDFLTDGESDGYGSSRVGQYENVTLPHELRGSINNYVEHLYESPIKTSAGDVHFSSDEVPNYFAHARIEDMADRAPNGTGGTRRVIEIQSDLFQKGRMSDYGYRGGVNTYEDALKEAGLRGYKGQEQIAKAKERWSRIQELEKLTPYRNTWWERIIREEVKQAAKDGKTKLQFPTGETAMKIEGLVNRSDKWVTLDNELITDGSNFKAGDLITYQTHDGVPDDYRRFLVTKNNNDGTFRAVDNLTAENDSDLYHLLESKEMLDDGQMPTLDDLVRVHGDDAEIMKALDKLAENLSAQNTVDKNNPIYKFYEKDVQKYLTKKYGGKVVTDPQGVKWIEIDVDPKAGDTPVEAFGAVPFLMDDKDED